MDLEFEQILQIFNQVKVYQSETHIGSAWDIIQQPFPDRDASAFEVLILLKGKRLL